MTKPITPDEAAKIVAIPDVVFEVFNRLITEKFDGQCARILQADVLGAIRQHTGDAVSMNWLNVERFYEAAGWKVEYSKPDYNDTFFMAYFVFTARKRVC
jgi:hypothetical protein